MGALLGTLLSFQNNRTMVEHPDFKARITYGTVNIQITEDEADRSGTYRVANISAEEHDVCFNQWYHQTNALQRVERQCEVSATRRAIAYRTVARVAKETKVDEKGKERTFEVTHLNEPSYLTYGELWDHIVSFGKGLAELGLPKRAKVALYEDTRWEWITSMLGLWTQEMIGVTIYANLGHDALIYALRESECSAIICNGKNASKLVQLLHEGHVAENTIIYLDELATDVDPSQHRLLRWGEVVQMGHSSTKPHTVVSNNDFEGLIMYTSGTTGNPKGVVHSLGSVTQGARGLNDRLTELLGVTEGETYVAFLPAAHIFEFVCEVIMLMRGTLLCYGSPRTLMDVFARPCGDLSQFKPFFLIGVPRIFETIKKTAEGRMPPLGSLKRQIFERAYESRLAALRAGMDTPFWNNKVFALPRSLLGPNIRGVCSGGAPLADKTQEWVNVVLGTPIAQGYGMTETVCNTTVQRTGELDCVPGSCCAASRCGCWTRTATSTRTTRTPAGSCSCGASSCSRATTSRPR
ncbi:long-chain acyl-CoA synthetase [Strigomonas culicis]|uniref:Long-chain acyl-CoA synthetase n=1 Tax=Strigomonas culicis TaxID=28005 RepID=S9TRT0_9TRYP|nr:long-chain acyl-CoA synthetase [Strigomonas culicis]|eukprot:EPY19304.1 long-chain acyl-CoA synthetase [Strigomonas culicis]